ncbi:MAG: malto-oligosyltrehalose synthase [Kofleriaceae bacterium]|nr:malto-oligosyltrehalose synthase [Kofleriaceae bacterium]
MAVAARRVMVAPRATYRLQLGPTFTFADAARAVPYLAELGISHLYLSPVLEAAEGSTHGYDVVDPDRVSGSLGGEEGFGHLVRTARAHGLGILLDIVPNHMSIAGTRNRWWLDVLENGPASYYATYFDVDWSGADDRVLLPVLGERYGRALTTGVLSIGHERGRFWARAHAQRFPISPRSVGAIVQRAGTSIGNAELAFLGESLAALPSSHERALEARTRRHRHKVVLLARVEELCGIEPAIAEALDAELRAINTDPAELDAILEFQNYRLVHWTVGGSQLSFRRFFDISTMVGIRNEDPDVLEAGHRRIFGWLADGTLDGVRVDHVDGLRDPEAYLDVVRTHGPDAWIVVEKILASDEQLPSTWPVDGTTGYEHADLVGRLLVDPEGEAALTSAFSAYTGTPWAPREERRRARTDVMSDALHAELARLTELAVRACASSPTCRDFTRAEIETTLSALLASYSVYRTYLGSAHARSEDRVRIAAAARAASAARELEPDLLAFLEASLAFELANAGSQVLAYAAQQVTGPIVAKGDEDTLAYRAVRLLARCEVGADIEELAASPSDVHARLSTARPRALLASSTHDSKRSEDVRARLAVLSEIPSVWEATALRWRTRAEAGWGDVPPDREHEYTMWQTLVGAWPLPEERAQLFAEKAAREARRRTSWRRPEPSFEAARARWLARIFRDQELLAEIDQLAARIAPHGHRNALAMLLIKLTAPGVPDVYQGCELASFTLVDPDNRRPVDLAHRERTLRSLDDAPLAQIAGSLDLAKLHTIRRVLALRRRAPLVFAGAYQPVAAKGPHAHRVFAFSRGDQLISVVPRLSVGAAGWPGTTLELPAGTWRDVLSERAFSSGTVTVADLWRHLPIALLARAS